MSITLNQDQGIVTRLDNIINYIKNNSLGSSEKDIYEFGVCTGNSTQSFLYHFKKYQITYNKFYGFDSFAGLPAEKEGLYIPDNWRRGCFNSQDMIGIKGVKNVVSHLYKRLKDYNNLELIPGFYADTLTDNLVMQKKLKPALFISMDVDLYISCYQVLDFMMRNNLVIPGTVIRYDDWLATRPRTGESLAHNEICAKYNKKFNKLNFEDTVIMICQ